MYTAGLEEEGESVRLGAPSQSMKRAWTPLSLLPCVPQPCSETGDGGGGHVRGASLGERR